MPARDNLIDAFEYLQHLDKLRVQPITQLSAHKLPIFHESAFVALPGIETDLVEGDTEVWLSIRRLRTELPPDPQTRLVPWISLPNDPAKEPSITDTILVESEQLPPNEVHASPDQPPSHIELRLEDEPEIQALFESYVTNLWEPWSKREKPRRQTIRLYDRLFSLMQDAEIGGSAEDGIELAWGIGIALWDHRESGKTITYPLISRTVEIHIDQKTMSILVAPTERDPLVHTDIFDALDLPHTDDIQTRARMEFEQSEKTLSPFDPGTFEGILRFASSQLDSHGVYWPDQVDDKTDRGLPQIRDFLTVTDTWVLFARKRSTSFIAADIKRLQQAVAEADELPPAPALIVTEPSDEPTTRKHSRYRGLSTWGLFGGMAGPADSGQDGALDLYFPKPFNAEQVAIIDRLDQSDGVVVQGPPGTGKTHTIANIICHYLALGKRVLVTSQHEAPLAVLQSQIPKELQPLTIALLTSERDGLKQLEQAVRKIAGEISVLDEQQLDREIRDETQRIDGLHQRLATLDHELREWARKQTATTPFLGGNTGPEELARYVVTNEKEHAWFPDRLDGDETTQLTLGDEQIRELRGARRRLGEDICYLGKVLPTTKQLPLPDDIARLHGDLLRLREVRVDTMEPGKVPPLQQYTIQSLRELEELRKIAIEALELLRKILREEWTCQVRPLLSGSSHNPVSEPLRTWIRNALDLKKSRQSFFARPVQMPVEAERNPELYDAVQRAASGQRPFRMLRGSKEVKSLFNQVLVGVVSPQSQKDWKWVADYLDAARKADELVVQWDHIRHEFGGPEIEGQGFNAIRPLADHANDAGAAWMLNSGIARRLQEKAQALFVDPGTFGQLTASPDALERLLASIDTHLEHNRLKACENTRKEIEASIAECSGAVVESMRDFLTSKMGADSVSAEQAMDIWQALLDELRRISARQGDLDTVDAVTQQIAAAGGQAWAQELRKASPDANTDPWLPESWLEAWEWSRARGYLDAIDGRKALMGLARDRTDAESRLRDSYLRIIQARTWRKLKENTTPKISAALQAYLIALTHIGRGMGVRATRHRRDARKAMNNAYGATPCWIMPHWRVSEALPAQLGLFDLVIIDEASQSDVWALPAIARGKKLLIVGDDKQVSPSDVGIREDDIRGLRRRFLANLPYGQHLLPGSSVYDLGSTMFSQDVIRLREHFRCVEPIIAFSNRQFYNDGIKPLRVPTPSERLDPPLIDVFVKGGYRQDRKKINKPEANAIVEEIQRLTEDPSTDNRTIGVVSLLGWEQAKYIQDRILDTLGEDVFLRHKIRCGDAMHFQGKEADIVMVSMVAAGSIRADSGRTYEQRYNVACSRARDRMYVFHSFTRGDVNDNDLRARLLDHLAQPLGGASEEAQELQELCDSDFEREVFDELVTRGYRVTPQVGAGGFRIDLVVEGAQDRRLAIECDGDQYHGVERWMEDVSRQRILERMGWRFWRCWASSWISTREECLDDLVGTLTKLGIEPWEGSSDAGSSSIVERRTIEPETAVMSDSAEGQEPYVEAVEAAGEVVQDEPAIPSDLPTEPKVA